MKPTKKICGNLHYNLKIGNRAVIYCDDSNTLLTSTVVDIRNKTDNGIEIETRNTIYKIKYNNNEKLLYAV